MEIDKGNNEVKQATKRARNRPTCALCTNHGFKYDRKGHKCELLECVCPFCKLTKRARTYNMLQLALWRYISWKCNRKKNVNSEKQMCDNCRNHGLFVEKKGHKDKCSWSGCDCEYCTFTQSRRNTMKVLQQVRRKKLTGNVKLPDNIDKKIKKLSENSDSHLSVINLAKEQLNAEDPSGSSCDIKFDSFTSVDDCSVEVHSSEYNDECDEELDLTTPADDTENIGIRNYVDEDYKQDIITSIPASEVQTSSSSIRDLSSPSAESGYISAPLSISSDISETAVDSSYSSQPCNCMSCSNSPHYSNSQLSTDTVIQSVTRSNNYSNPQIETVQSPPYYSTPENHRLQVYNNSVYVQTPNVITYSSGHLDERVHYGGNQYADLRVDPYNHNVYHTSYLPTNYSTSLTPQLRLLHMSSYSHNA